MVLSKIVIGAAFFLALLFFFNIPALEATHLLPDNPITTAAVATK